MALLHLHRDWAHPPRASAPGLQVLPEDMLKLVPPSAPALIDALTHAILYDVHEVLSPLSVFCVRVRACVRACVWLLPECACLLATCVRSECARARLHSAGVCTAGRPDAVPPGRAQVLQLARRGGADRISLSERNYRMQRRACPISAMQRRAGPHERDASGAHLRRRSLSKPIAARAEGRRLVAPQQTMVTARAGGRTLLKVDVMTKRPLSLVDRQDAPWLWHSVCVCARARVRVLYDMLYSPGVLFSTQFAAQ